MEHCLGTSESYCINGGAKLDLKQSMIYKAQKEVSKGLYWYSNYFPEHKYLYVKQYNKI